MTIQDQQLDELREALKELREDEPVTNSGAATGSLYTRDTITLSGAQLYNNTVIGGGYTVGTGMNFPNSVSANTGPYYTINNGTSITASPWASINTTTQAGRMELNGDAADLVINGVSILDILTERLNVLIPNPALEKEWDQLKELGDQYRKLEKDLKEKAEIWAKLNKPS
jgi:hypothetical protein